MTSCIAFAPSRKPIITRLQKKFMYLVMFEIGNKLSQKAVAIWPITGQAKLPASPIFF